MEKGATAFDKLCHKVFAAKGNGYVFMGSDCGVQCGMCGHDLSTYYCESGLYLVECEKCNVRALVMAGNAQEAAYSTFGNAVYPVDEMGEECAVFFAHTPILCLECSVCGRNVDNSDLHFLLELGEYGVACQLYPYCHCGAKMDLEDEEP